MSDEALELEQARKTNRELNRRVQELEKAVRLAEGRARKAENLEAYVRRQKEEGKRRLLATGGSWSAEVAVAFGEAVVERDEALAENAVMKKAFADFCQDSAVCALARREGEIEGRHQTLKRWLETKHPACEDGKQLPWSWWRRDKEEDLYDHDDLPPFVFDRLKGTPDGSRPYRRFYATREEAIADKDRAIEAEARAGAGDASG